MSKREVCEKCGETGHTLAKCSAGKSLKDMKKANPDKSADAKLGEKVEAVVEQHMLDNKEAEKKEGHAIMKKSEESNYSGYSYNTLRKWEAPAKAVQSYGDLKKSEEEQDQPDEHDIFFHPTGPLGAKTAFSANGKHVSTHDSDEEAHAAAHDWCKANKFFPNAWNVSDHGNHHLMEGFHASAPKAEPKKNAASKAKLASRKA
jgi:hypothetical protein